MTRGRLITIEGIDGAGQDDARRGAARRAERRAGVDVQLLREPGGVRRRRADPRAGQGPGCTIGARAEALLYAAARAQLVEEALEPLLAAGTLGTARPLRRLLAGLPGRGARARDRRGARHQRVRDRAAAPRSHAAARDRPGLARSRSVARARAARPARAARATTFFARIAAAYAELAGRRAGADPDDRRRQPPEQVLWPRSASSPTCSEPSDLL